jgi:protein arginine kinase
MFASFDELADQPVNWLSGSGEHADIVLSSRTRLARNLSRHRYPVRAEPDEARAVVELVKAVIKKSTLDGGGTFFDAGDLAANEREFLVERHLISPEFIRDDTPRGLYIDDGESSSLMVNEEDHLRIQAVSSGLDIKNSLKRARNIENELATGLEFDCDPRLGYLTACPTNVGTGLRVSVMIHLPGLVLTKEMDSVLSQVNKFGVGVRGFYGEGSDVLGNLFQISNQTTLGRTEEDLVESLEQVTRKLLTYEGHARQRLFTDAPDQIKDKLWRAYGILANARVLSSQEVMNLLSAVRLGVAMGEPMGLDLAHVNELMLLAQPAHIQRLFGKEMKPEERDVARAELARKKLVRKRPRRRSGGGSTGKSGN